MELKDLNRLTTILLDIFEDQLNQGRLTMMAEATALLHNQLKGLGRVVLQAGGRVSTAAAKFHAEKEYETYKARLVARRHAEADKAIAEIKSETNNLPGGRPKR